MAYNHLETMDLYNLIHRWHRGYTISQIGRALKLDRKTIRGYIKLAEKVGLSRNQPLPEKTELLQRLQAFLPSNQRSSPVRNLLTPHKDEIIGLINDKIHPLKPKTAYEVICERYTLDVSYGTFKRFIRAHAGDLAQLNSTCRFEIPQSGTTRCKSTIANWGCSMIPAVKKSVPFMLLSPRFHIAG